jgi:hypothetical protein
MDDQRALAWPAPVLPEIHALPGAQRVAVSAARTCAGMSSGPSVVWR